MRFNKMFLFLILLIFKAQIFCMYYDEEFEIRAARETQVVRGAFEYQFGPNSTFQRMGAGISGGGYRSMISGIGMLAALEELGLYNCITYTAGVSGGTWAILPLSLRDVSPIEYAKILKKRMCITKISRPILQMKQVWPGLEMEFVDLWGAYIGERLLGDLPPEFLTFETVRDQLNKDTFQPFPLFSTVIGQTVQTHYEWVEISPFRVYSKHLGGSIATRELGSKFAEGKITTPSREKGLEFFLGLFGSAFCFTPEDIVNNVCEDFVDKSALSLKDRIYKSLTGYLGTFSKEIHMYYHRNFATTLPNYSFHTPDSQMPNDENLQLIDAGYSCNLPIPPLLRPDRGIDIIFLCDASAEEVKYSFPELKKAAILAKRLGLKFPPINRCKSNNPNLKIFYDEDPSVPMIIYFEHENKFPTTKMSYEEAEFDEVFRDSYNAITDHKNTKLILEALNYKAGAPNDFDDIPDVALKLD